MIVEESVHLCRRIDVSGEALEVKKNPICEQVTVLHGAVQENLLHRSVFKSEMTIAINVAGVWPLGVSIMQLQLAGVSDMTTLSHGFRPEVTPSTRLSFKGLKMHHILKSRKIQIFIRTDFDLMRLNRSFIDTYFSIFFA